METLVVVAQHKNQYPNSRVTSNHGHGGRFGSPGHFREINCRTNYQSGPGLLPSPFETLINTTPVAKRNSPSFKTPSPSSIKSARSVDGLRAKVSGLSSLTPFHVKVSEKDLAFNEEVSAVKEKIGFSELWAGPAYSNSPPPSCLPIPKFSVKPKRTVSLDLPALESEFSVELHTTAKSAPSSPTREHNTSVKDLCLSVDSATRTLRRILNLDVADE